MHLLASGGLMLALSSLCMWRFWVLYLGFVQYMFGTGCALCVLGIMNLGTGSLGQVIGSGSIFWGVLSIFLHFYFKSSGAVVHIPLMR